MNTNWIEPNERVGARPCTASRRRSTSTGRSSTPSSRSPRASRELGDRIALAQTLLKLTCPGVPDVYQGDEL